MIDVWDYNEEPAIKIMREELMDFHVGNKYSVCKDRTQIIEANEMELFKLHMQMVKVKEKLKEAEVLARTFRIS